MPSDTLPSVAVYVVPVVAHVPAAANDGVAVGRAVPNTGANVGVPAGKLPMIQFAVKPGLTME